MLRVLLALCLAGALSGAEVDPATKISFPAEAGAWAYAKSHTYDQAALGRSYAYNPKSSGNGAITIYVYDKGLANIPTGADSRLMKLEIEEIVAGIKTSWTERGATVETLEAARLFRYSPKTPPVAYYGLSRISYQGVRNLSISIVTGYRGNFLKLRYTHPGNDLDVALHDIRVFLEALHAANRETLDPAFAPPATAP